MLNKKIWLVSLLVLPLYGDLSIGQMDTMVEKIKAKRVGTTLEKRVDYASPFVIIQKDKGKTVIEDPKGAEVVFVLSAIINDKAFINKIWVKVGEKLEGYELTKLEEKSATLVQQERVIKIFLKKTKSILQLNEGQE